MELQLENRKQKKYPGYYTNHENSWNEYYEK